MAIAKYADEGRGERAIFRRSEHGRIAIAPAALGQMTRCRQRRWWNPEQGGMLLGRLQLDSEDITIDVATAPSALDRASRFLFVRVQEPAQRLVNQHWRDSGGTCNYLGEWHTHPEEIPHPSGHDRDNWHRIFRMASFTQDFLLFAIVGTKELRMWEQRNDRLLLTHREALLLTS